MASLISIIPLIFLLFTTFCYNGEARLVVVGGSLDGWKVPESSNNTLNHWAKTVRFQVGDILVFYYDMKTDSVLEVTKENYESCNTEKPLKEYKGERNKVKLHVSGPHFFISGSPAGNCGKGEKMIIVVQSPNHPPMPKPGPGSSAPTTSPVVPPSHSSKPPTSSPAPAPAPAKNTAVGLVAGNGIFWASTLVAVFGLAWA